MPVQLSRTIETLYRSESGRVLATLVRLLGDPDLAKEGMHEAFAAALQSWPQTGIPDKPRPWRISTARFKAIDRMRQRARFDGETQKDFALYHYREGEARDNVGLLAKGAEQSDGGPPQCSNKICRYPPSGGSCMGPAESLAPAIIEGIRRIKAQDGPDLILSGSSTLTSPLLEHGLADEVLLVVYPALLGTGKRVFAEGTPPRPFELVCTKALASGVILGTYELNAPLRTGTMGG